MLLSEVPLWFLRAVAIALGLLWGSFLNVVIYRVPRGMSVVHPPSHCPACGKPVRAFDNVPVLGFFLLAGRARCCGAPLSPRYPLVEAIGGALSLAIVEVVVRALPGETTLLRAGAVYLADFALCLGLVAAAFIDAEHMYLPDPITLGGTALGLVTAHLRGLSIEGALIGAAVGFVGLWFPFIFIYARLRGRAGMGLGDAKLTMLAGAWFGWWGAAFVLLAGAVQGTIAAIVIFAVKGRIDEPEAVRADREELQRAAREGDLDAQEALRGDPLAEAQGEGFGQARLPFGPFLILSCLELLFAGQRWVAYLTAL